MPNVSSNPAVTASATLVIESNKQQTSSATSSQAVQSPQAITLSTGEQVQLESYTVKKGDTLWDIAGVKMGNPNNWPMLFALNQNQIKNPNLIHPGQVLMVPQRIAIAPSVPQPQMPSPEPAPVQPAPQQPAQPAAQEEVITPQPAAQEPAAPAPVQAAPQQSAAPEAVSQADLEWALQLQQKVEGGYEPSPEEVARYNALVEKAQAAETAAQPQSTEPAAQQPVVLRPPDQLPPAAEEAPVVQQPQTPQAVQPSTPQPEPVKPQVPAVVGTPLKPETKGSGLGKAALIGGAIGTATTGAVLVGLTAKLGSNLGGYATAQVVAKTINTVTSKVGLSLPTGPALSKLVSKVGGPKVAGTVAAVGTGLVVAGLAAGGYYLYKKATDKGESAPPAKAPEQTPAPVQQPAAPVQAPQTPAAQPVAQSDLEWALQLQQKVQAGYQPSESEVTRYNSLVDQAQAAEAPTQPTAPAQADPNNPIANITPVADPNARPPVDVAPLHKQLGDLLGQKQYMFFGNVAQPEQVRALGVQIWLDGKLDDRVQLANALVKNGQAELLGRVMSHEETTTAEITQVMSQAQFPVGEYMKALDDNRAFQVLHALAGEAVKGNAAASGVIAQTVQAYDGWRDREAPFNRLKQQHQALGNWDKLPADLRGKIDELLK